MKKQTGLFNPHDKFFKAIMEEKNTAIAFLNKFLPQTLKELLLIEELEYIKTSFVTPDLEESFADVVFRIPLRSKKGESIFVSVIIEHKSYADELACIQLLGYLAGSYQKQIKSRKPLEIVIPILYYHGKERWQIPDMNQLFKSSPEYLKKYLPNFNILFVDLLSLNENSIETLTDQLLKAALLTQFHRFDIRNVVKPSQNFEQYGC